ncbi:MAG: hypothetical protein N2746_12310 [Deltaproteobacteria bacterium]|nr:hypothetical protein [Deltaproteobacteria bacterium]
MNSIIITLILNIYMQVGPIGIIQMPTIFGEFKPNMGDYVEYRVHELDSDSVQIIKISIVGETNCEEGTDKKKKPQKCYWVEIFSRLESSGHGLLTKMLVSGDIRDPANIKKMYSRIGKRNPVVMKPEDIAKMPKSIGQDIPKNAKIKKQKEPLKVALKTITTTVYDFRIDKLPFTVWMSKDVPIFGMAKLKSPDLEIDIIEIGKGAKSEMPEVKEAQEQKPDNAKPANIKLDKEAIMEEKKESIDEREEETE